ncbi:telomeric repeat-binding factor 1 [Platysternon megacephalum]|uniref:Telomeric repeat-binding factor 1 n=1 Tax=Platysternon megacephalum TaxID=55544 RepID=A0A4D9EFG1_9SAUR|nr:telomeric repeat-binding factor 1 [Platysternon megacephalum]
MLTSLAWSGGWKQELLSSDPSFATDVVQPLVKLPHLNFSPHPQYGDSDNLAGVLWGLAICKVLGSYIKVLNIKVFLNVCAQHSEGFSLKFKFKKCNSDKDTKIANGI